MFTTVFIDVDNTLLDFNECAKASMRQTFSEVGLCYGENMFSVFTAINNELWRALERGELDRAGLHAIRWNTIFSKLGISYDGVAFEHRFEQLLAESHVAVEGATEALEYLSKRYTVCTVTNGFASTQKNRLAAAGMDKFIHDDFVSEKAGYSKPDARFFDYCFKALGQPAKSDVLLIGDSLSADVAGGISYGLCTCWYNHNQEPAPISPRPDYVINKISDVKNLF